MLLVQQSDRSLKRRRSLSLDRTTETKAAKQQRQTEYSDSWIPSERFWDTLPQIRLTRHALIEHNRRNQLQDSRRQTEERLNPPFPRRRSARLRQVAQGQRLVSLRSPGQTTPSAHLRRFARGGGPDLTDIRGCADPTMSNQTGRGSKRTTSSGLTTSSKRSGPYDANYELKLAQAGIFVAAQKDEKGYRILPANHADIVGRLKETRPSLSPSRFTEQDFERFQEQAEREILESETMKKSIAVIEGTRGPKHTHTGSQFNNIEPFDPDLKIAVPDLYDGASPLSIDHRVLHSLATHIIPSTDTSRAAAPNFFFEGKGAGGRADVAKRQAAHNGAIGARGLVSLQSYPASTLLYDNKARSFTNTYHDGTLKMYTTHATAPKETGGQPQYHMTQIDTFGMTGNSTTFRQGATHYRNARDLAQEQRDLLIQQANQAVRQIPMSKHSHGSQSTTNTRSVRTSVRSEEHASSPDSDTSLDELARDNNAIKRPRNAKLVDDDEDDGAHISFTMSTPARARVTPHPLQTASRAARSKHVPGATSPIDDDPNSTSFTTSPKVAEPPVRPRQPSKKLTAADLQEVHVRQTQKDGVAGREFTIRKRRVFVPHQEWQRAKKAGREVWVNWERQVYCLAD